MFAKPTQPHEVIAYIETSGDWMEKIDDLQKKLIEKAGGTYVKRTLVSELFFDEPILAHHKRNGRQQCIAE